MHQNGSSIIQRRHSCGSFVPKDTRPSARGRVPLPSATELAALRKCIRSKHQRAYGTDLHLSGYQGLSLNPAAPLSRPASGARCWSSMQPTGLLVTYYVNGTALSTSTQTPIGPSHHVFAQPYDGIWNTISRSTAEDGRVVILPQTSIPTSGMGAPVQTEEVTGSVSVPAIIPTSTTSASGAYSVQGDRIMVGAMVAMVVSIISLAVLL